MIWLSPLRTIQFDDRRLIWRKHPYEDDMPIEGADFCLHNLHIHYASTNIQRKLFKAIQDKHGDIPVQYEIPKLNVYKCGNWPSYPSIMNTSRLLNHNQEWWRRDS